MINSSLRVFFAVSLLRLACFFTELAVLLRRPPQRSTEPSTPALSDHTYVDILNEFEPDDDSTQIWLDFIASDPDARASTLDFLELCLEHE